MKDIFLLLGGFITIAAVLPYLRDILKHKTKPSIVSWLTWCLLNGLAAAAAISAHEYRTAIFCAAVMAECGLVVLMGLRHGYVKYTRFDVVCQIGAVVGLILWQLFDSPLTAIIATVLIDLIATLPTLRHAWFKPYEETWQTYALSGLGAALAVLGLTAYNAISLTSAVYIVLINIVVTSTILYRRQPAGHKSV